MIDMFTNYQNLSEYYIPNNLSKSLTTPKSYTKLDPVEASKPYELYNAKGELEGYYWYYGNQLNLEFSIDGEITVESTAIILTAAGAEPGLITPARLGQKVYNIFDLKSWTCIGYENQYFIWQLDSEFIYPINGERAIYVEASNYLANKKLDFSIYDFRYNQIYNKQVSGTTSLIIPIDSELSAKMVKGVYYCSLEIVSADSRETLFSPADCKLLVK